MGKGHPVSVVYMGIRSGVPLPMMTTSVGVGREERVEGVREAVRVRRYSWQFCGDGGSCQILIDCCF